MEIYPIIIKILQQNQYLSIRVIPYIIQQKLPKKVKKSDRIDPLRSLQFAKALGKLR